MFGSLGKAKMENGKMCMLASVTRHDARSFRSLITSSPSCKAGGAVKAVRSARPRMRDPGCILLVVVLSYAANIPPMNSPPDVSR